MSDVEIVEEHYRNQLLPNGRRARRKTYKFTTSDRALVRKQLKIFTVDELCEAISQTHRTPWNIGDNPGAKKHLRLGLCIDDDHLNERLDAAEEHADREKRRHAANTDAVRQVSTTPADVSTPTRELYRQARKQNTI